jgi:hypothetical protein
MAGIRGTITTTAMAMRVIIIIMVRTITPMA